MHTADVLRRTLAKATTSDGLPNKDLDTGGDARPGKLLAGRDLTCAICCTRRPADPASPMVPFGIKRDLVAYFADSLSKVTYLNQEDANAGPG